MLLSEKIKRAATDTLHRLKREPASRVSLCRALLSFFLPALLLLLAYFASGLYPFGENSPLSYDLNAQYVHFLAYLKNAFADGHSLIYSWSRTLGGEFLGMMAYYLISPFNLIILIFPTSMLESAVLLTVLCKTGAIGSAAYAYLHRGRGLSGANALIFSLAYSLSAYSVVYGSNLMWLDDLMLLPLLTWGTERLVRDGKFSLFVFSLIYGVSSNYYIGFMLCIYTLLYFFVFYFGEYSESTKDTVIYDKFRFPKALARISISSLAALCASAAVLLPAYRSLTFGKTEFLQTDMTPAQTADFLQILRKLLIGSYDSVDNFAEPFIYCGMLTLIFAPLFFISKGIGIREKLSNGLLLLFLFTSMSLTTLDAFWHGFQFPNGLPYRYSFIFTFVLCVCAAKAFEARKSYSKRAVCTACAGIILLIFSIQAQKYIEGDTFTCIWLSIGITVCYLTVYCLIERGKTAKFTEITAATLICAELFTASALSLTAYEDEVVFGKHGSLESYIEKYESAVDTVQKSDSGLYRTERVGSDKLLNDPFSLSFRGISGSTSTLNSSVIKLMNTLGYGADSNFVRYSDTSPAADAVFGVKYIISSETLQNGAFTLSEALSAECGDENVYIYENPYALPIAYTANRAVISHGIQKYPTPFEAVNGLYSSLLGEEASPYVPCTISRTQYGGIYHYTIGGNIYFEPHEEESEREYFFLDFILEIQTDGAYYAAFPGDAANQAELLVNGETVCMIKSYDGTHIQLLGSFSKDDTVNVRLKWKDGRIGLSSGVNYFYRLDEQQLASAAASLNAGGITVTEHSDTKIKGTFTYSPDRSALFTTIPFDSDWSVKIDDQEIPSSIFCDSLLGADLSSLSLSEGEHTVELSFSSASFTVGIIISSTATAALITAALIPKIKPLCESIKKRRKENKR